MVIISFLFYLFSKLINLANPGTIDTRAINVKKPLNIFNKDVYFFCLYLFRLI